jgi:hypothetical protein
MAGGAGVIDQLARDLRAAFPHVRGFSARNLGYMKALAQAWPDKAILQAVLAELPRCHNLTLLEKVEGAEKRLWYARRALEQGWTRHALVGQIERRLFDRQGRALTNFERTLPPPQSKLATESLKDPYTLDFLTVSDDVVEAALERGLIEHIRKFLLVAEYALRDNRKPIGVAAYQLVTALPEPLQDELPSIEVLEAEIVRPRR